MSQFKNVIASEILENQGTNSLTDNESTNKEVVQEALRSSQAVNKDLVNKASSHKDQVDASFSPKNPLVTSLPNLNLSNLNLPNVKAIKLLFSDLDGSLLNEKSQLSEFTKKTLQAAQAKKFPVCIATGRPYNSVLKVFDPKEFDLDLILLNGAEYRLADGTLVKQIGFEKERALAILRCLDALKGENLAFEVNTNKGDFCSSATFRFSAAKALPAYQEFCQSDLLIQKFFILAEQKAVLDAAKKQLLPLCENGGEFTYSGQSNLEIVPAGVSKERMIKQVLEERQLKAEDIYVFGDSANDLGMFKSFPFAFAMGNAITEVKSLAKYHTLANHEHGVAKVLAALLAAKA